MKKLSEIIVNLNLVESFQYKDREVSSVCFDSRKIISNCLFVALTGTKTDGHQFVESCINAGATTIIYETTPDILHAHVTYIKVSDSSKALGIVACNYYDNPSEKVNLVGITGTNGKTTTATLLYNLFKQLGYKVGLLSTVRNMIDTEEVAATHTTPDQVQLNYMLNQMVKAGCSHAFMEVSSHAIVQNRIAGLKFDGGVFTNITHDHLDYHKTFDAYIKAKKEFFDSLNHNAFALTNKDDRNGEVMLQNTTASKYSYSLKSSSDFKCKIVESHFIGQLLDVDGMEMWSKLIGNFNASNILAIYATAVLLGEEKFKVLTEISKLESVDGRFQYIKSDKEVVGIVDYAHTPDALENVINTINELRAGSTKLICVVGCGGDRDAKKRPIMASIACDGSDKVILTSDNPRSEDPQEIINEMLIGVDPVGKRKTLTIVDRKEAIRTACMMAQKGDIILVAGKGHEKYQEIKGIRHLFDDTKILEQELHLNE